MLKVSVVIPTYNSPTDALAALVASVDAQTLPATDFEVIFVDDGSTDDTHERLVEVARDRPHVRVERIENSGWPSKPRNIGIDLARGEYILFMDHDDQLYPDALRGAYAYAHDHAADVLNGKESYTNSPNWGLNTYDSDRPQALDRDDIHPLVPLNPHKLYRSEFIREHSIRFPEGRRVFWEDQYFNIAVGRHARVISTLASVPFYHWVFLADSGTSLFDVSTDDYWRQFRDLLAWTQDQLAEGRLRTQLELLMRHQYEVRVLGIFTREFPEWTIEQREALFEHTRRVRTEFDLGRFDTHLSSSRRARAWVLAHGDAEMMSELCTQDARVPAIGRATAVAWKDGVLQVRASVQWGEPDGDRLWLQRRPGGIVRALSSPVLAEIPEDVRDLTGDIADARADISVRGRVSRLTWMTPTESLVDVTAGEETASLNAQVTAEIDPASAALGGPLDPVTWDVLVRTQLGKSMTHRALYSDVPASVSLVDERLHLFFSTAQGRLCLRPDAAVEAVRRLTPLSARVSDGQVEVHLSGVHDGDGSIASRVAIARSSGASSAVRPRAATLHISEGRASVTFSATPGTMRVRIGDRVPGATGMWELVVPSQGVDGSIELRPAVEPSAVQASAVGGSEASGSSGQQRSARPQPSKVRRALRRLLGRADRG